MTKMEIIKMVSKQTRVSRNQTKTVLESVLQVIQSSLLEGEKITLHNFGTFYVKEYGEKKAWNPRDGVPVKVPAKRVVKFKSSLNKKT
jgi:DNA-binding protein HU-beta